MGPASGAAGFAGPVEDRQRKARNQHRGGGKGRRQAPLLQESHDTRGARLDAVLVVAFVAVVAILFTATA